MSESFLLSLVAVATLLVVACSYEEFWHRRRARRLRWRSMNRWLP